jgi:hypothetical protein
MTGGRSGLLPARLGRLRQPSQTPVNALIVMTVAGLGVIGVWWIIHLVIGHTGSMDPVGLYAGCSTMGTIVILVVYLLTSISLPVFCGVATARCSLPSAMFSFRPWGRLSWSCRSSSYAHPGSLPLQRLPVHRPRTGRRLSSDRRGHRTPPPIGRVSRSHPGTRQLNGRAAGISCSCTAAT